MTRHRHCGSARAAHTLWEVLLVLSLLGALAALAAPAVRDVRRPAGPVDETTRDLVALLERARLTAVERGLLVDVRLDPASGRAWVFDSDGDTLHLLAISSFTRVSAVDLLGDEPRSRYVFTPTGAGFGTPLVLRGIGGARRITLDPWTGGIRVSR